MLTVFLDNSYTLSEDNGEPTFQLLVNAQNSHPNALYSTGPWFFDQECYKVYTDNQTYIEFDLQVNKNT